MRFGFNSVFPLSSKLPNSEVDVHDVFIKPHNPSSDCESKLAGDEESNGDEMN